MMTYHFLNLTYSKENYLPQFSCLVLLFQSIGLWAYLTIPLLLACFVSESIILLGQGSRFHQNLWCASCVCAHVWSELLYFLLWASP